VSGPVKDWLAVADDDEKDKNEEAESCNSPMAF
jgi:hypothetical protein